MDYHLTAPKLLHVESCRSGLLFDRSAILTVQPTLEGRHLFSSHLVAPQLSTFLQLCP